jgi:hypothetical protein
MGTGVSPWGKARGRLARRLAGWVTDTAGAGLRRGRATKAERARERLCEMGRGSECGCGRCSKGSWGRGRATWSGIWTSVRECARAGPRRVAGKAELTGVPMAQRERTGAWRNGSAS